MSYLDIVWILPMDACFEEPFESENYKLELNTYL